MTGSELSTTISVEPEVARLVDDTLGYTADELRSLCDEGLASGPGREVDFEEIKQEVFRRAGVARSGV